jgi:hypothetical protein
MKVFLSYAREDIEYRDEVLAALGHLKRVNVEIWVDRHIPPGSNWERELEVQLRTADAAILLVSRDFLGSDPCMDTELPVLRAKEIRLFPILVRSIDLGAHELREIEFFDPLGRMEPLANLTPPQRDEVWARLSEVLRKLAGNPPGHRLIARQQREDFVSRILPAGTAHITLQHDTLKRLLEAYLELYARKLIEEAQDLFEIFNQRVDQFGLKVSDPMHKGLLDLLAVGLPLKPVHLQDISRLDLESLLSNPGYAALLHGIRLTDIDYELALEHLRCTRKEHQLRCSLFAYAEAQCLRKMKRFEEAHSTLEDGESFLGDFKDGLCLCGPNCQSRVLQLQIHRGFGTVCRNLVKQEREAGRHDAGDYFRKKAESHFESCLRLEDKDVPATVRSDIRYSYGYFVFEMAFLDHEGGSDTETFHRELHRAEALFKASRDLNRTFAAPLARLAIVQHLLGQPAFYNYLHARDIALKEKSGESPLTAVVCGFAMQLLAHERRSGKPRLPPASALLDELCQLLEERHFSEGPLECHAFDCRVVRLGYGRDLPDPALATVYELLTEAATWETANLADQKSRLHSFLTSRKPQG